MESVDVTLVRFQDSRYFSHRPWMEYVFLFSTFMAQLVSQLGTNYALSLLKVLSSHFDANDGQRTWFMSSFSLAMGTLILISGRIGDVYGLRNAIVAGYTITAIGSLLSGVSFYVPNPVFYIVSRAIQGIGTSLILPNVLGAAGRIYIPGSRRKQIVFSMIGFSAPLGGCIAPLISGLIAVKTQYWNWICYVTLIASVLGAVVSWMSIPKFDRRTQSMDWIGCAIGIVSLVLLSFSWNQAGVDGWVGYLDALLVISIALLVVFVWWEKTRASNPLVPMNLDIRVGLSLLTVGLGWGSWGIAYYRFFVFVLYLRNYSALGAGACVAPVIISGTAATVAVGYFLKHFSVYTLLLVSTAPFIVYSFLLQYMPIHQTYFQNSMAIFIVCVWGLDWSFPLGTIILSDALPEARQGMAGSLVTTAINYSTSVFLGIAGTVERQVLLRRPGDVMAAHKACTWLSTGVTFGAVITALILFLFSKAPEKAKDSEKLSEFVESKSESTHGELEAELKPEISRLDSST